MIDFIKVGNKIAEYRIQSKLTQEDLAASLFITRQLVSKWENGTGVPSIDVLLELSKLFNTNFEDLLCLNEESEISEENIFKGRNRLYVISSIINNELKVNLPEVFYQFASMERMMVLKAIKEGSLECDLAELFPKLTIGEQNYLRKGE